MTYQEELLAELKQLMSKPKVFMCSLLVLYAEEVETETVLIHAQTQSEAEMDFSAYVAENYLQQQYTDVRTEVTEIAYSPNKGFAND